MTDASQRKTEVLLFHNKRREAELDYRTLRTFLGSPVKISENNPIQVGLFMTLTFRNKSLSHHTKKETLATLGSYWKQQKKKSYDHVTNYRNKGYTI